MRCLLFAFALAYASASYSENLGALTGLSVESAGTLQSSRTGLNLIKGPGGRDINLAIAIASDDARGQQSTLRSPRATEIFASTSAGTVVVVADDGIGSGALITRAGHIVTNYHVVEKSKEILVAFVPIVAGERPKRSDFVRAELVKVNQIKDLALLKVERIPSHARPIALSSAEIKVGEDVHAVGHPKKQLWTYTKGYVSQVRKGYAWSGGEGSPKHLADVIQTQTPINPGNSGGPLVNDNRELVGINSFIDPAASGLNYAVHVSEVRALLSQQGSVYAPKNAPKSRDNCGENAAYEREASSEFLGKYVAVGIDRDCDGHVEAEFRIPNDKKKPIVLAVDSKKNGKIDVVFLDNDRDGKWDISYHDTDGDGKADLIGYHPDGTLVASRFEKIRG